MKFLFFLFFLTSQIWANANVFETLLKKVEQGYKVQTDEDKQRQKQFLSEVKEQQKKLQALELELKHKHQLSKKLSNQINTNEKGLEKLTEKLQLLSGDLGELFGTIKQVSSDVKVYVKSSITSAQYPKRVEFLNNITTNTQIPDIQELKKLWYIMLQEIIASGEIVQFKTKIISDKSTKNKELVTRIGNFNAITKYAFLHYNTDEKIFTAPSYQPGFNALQTINSYVDSKKTIENAVIDPTKGVILDMLSQKPTFKERIKQGGIIGYIIITLAFIGILFALGKYLWLGTLNHKIAKQLKDLSQIRENNPLGKILKTYEQSANNTLSDLEYKIDETFYKQIPPLLSGFSMIKLFAATAPLLGLLGTVTGMILTFQSITLFGTNDPKLMAGGISQALITTMLGLIAAIPLLFAHTLLNAKAKKIITILEQNSAELIAKKIDENV